MDHLYQPVGRVAVYVILGLSIGVSAAVIYCILSGLFRGALAFAIDRRNKRLIGVAKYARHLQLMSPTAFEHLCKNLFLKQGYRVKHVGEQSDGGVDLLIGKDGTRGIVQCKQYSRKPIGRPTLQQFYGSFEDNHAVMGFVVTTSYFSGAAFEFAKGKPITLVDRRLLVLWINQYLDGKMEEEPSLEAGDEWHPDQLICPDCQRPFVPPFKPEGFAPVYCWECRRKRRGAA